MQVQQTATTNEWKACQFHKWYPVFRSVTIKSQQLPFPPAFLAYLESDGVFIPDEAHPISSEQDDQWVTADSNMAQEIDDAEQSANVCDPDDVDDAVDDHVTNQPFFPAFMVLLDAAIQELGGAVFPKLSWSSPRDATWMAATRTLKCTSPGDILLLLKSSDAVQADLQRLREQAADAPTDPSIGPTDPYMVLRKWSHLLPAQEFRVFVIGRTVVGACQRAPNFYPHLARMTDEYNGVICDFFLDHLIKFPLHQYMADVYIDSVSQDVYLIDVGVLESSSETLLFSWEELCAAASSSAARCCPPDSAPPSSSSSASLSSSTPPATSSSSPSKPKGTSQPPSSAASPQHYGAMARAAACLELPPDLLMQAQDTMMINGREFKVRWTEEEEIPEPVFEVRVITSNGSGMDIPRTAKAIANRLPKETHLCMSDAAAIERFATACQEGLFDS